MRPTTISSEVQLSFTSSRLAPAAESPLLTPADAAAPADAAVDCAPPACRNAAMRVGSLVSDNSLSRPTAVLPLLNAADPLPPPPPPPLESARDLPLPAGEGGGVMAIRGLEIGRVGL